MNDPLVLGGEAFESRLMMGSSRFPSPQTMLEALRAAEAQIVTVSVRRLNLAQKQATFLDALSGFKLLPNTAGCRTARDAVFTAELAREALSTSWVKVEVIADDETLLPDGVELVKACAELLKLGFTVLPYCPDDPALCKRLADMGCAAVMPLAAPIGSGLGIRNPHALAMIRRMCEVPVVVDAGVGTASDAAVAMELGCDAVLLNTAVARAQNPVLMAEAMKWAVRAGRAAFLAGRIAPVSFARPSTPLEGVASPWP
ncbi:MAG: thiazole synthase [Bacteroidia bacterium]|nr:thiazole synthase [Bacteroidia bacterium]MDW8333624.1 thiazole synthase [Bacteroidia bacterium]